MSEVDGGTGDIVDRISARGVLFMTEKNSYNHVCNHGVYIKILF